MAVAAAARRYSLATEMEIFPRLKLIKIDCKDVINFSTLRSPYYILGNSLHEAWLLPDVVVRLRVGDRMLLRGEGP